MAVMLELAELSSKVARSLAQESAGQSWQALFGARPPWRGARSLARERYRYMIRSPWPQPNPHAPTRLPPSVLHLPSAELSEFRRVTIGRLTRALRQHSVPAMRFAVEHAEYPALSDADFAHHLTQTVMCRGMSPSLTPAERARLELPPGLGGTVYKYDTTPAALLRPLPGLHIAGAITYLLRPRPGAPCEPLAVAIEPRAGDDAPLLIRAGDGPAWELAKYHAMQGVTYCAVFGHHPLNHFPADAINAVSKTVLPPAHPLARLLAPHFFNQLSLNFSVMFIDKSPLHNRQREFFTGFANDGPESPLELFSAYYCGDLNHEDVSAYRWPREPPRLHGDYGDFVRGYHRVIMAFVEEALDGVALDDAVIERWLEAAAAHVPGFPGPGSARADVLAAIGQVIYNASIAHSVDHYSFSTIPLLDLCMRLRLPPPRSRDLPSLDRGVLTTLEDRFRMYLTYLMHVRPSTHRALREVDYGFEDPRRVAAQARFIAALEAYDADPGVTRHAPLDEIAVSIQY
ncbi:hypothetical protein PPSIR1_13055 [Plesiocystis pacifica SIR-1]|uniref:Lipoxygenase domain-containing protein n=1 Tax=Plesiocystis pacifica SIR-1 TaxID=391625 RepID=A6GAV8_9BACT|nr:hypothetical protein [Plesiocystis pacifica]EDM76943.1 hypothetical protein PPSIR1_13055 [Plesiocystis pacifica SIR-1]